MSAVPAARLNLARAAYLLVARGPAATCWRSAGAGASSYALTNCLLGALAALALLGLRYPLGMLPVLLLDLARKAAWLEFVGLPLRLDGPLYGAALETTNDCLLMFVLGAIVPWRHVAAEYVINAPEPWR